MSWNIHSFSFQIYAGLSLQRTGFNMGTLHLVLIADNLAHLEVFFSDRRFLSPVNHIPWRTRRILHLLQAFVTHGNLHLEFHL